MHCYILPKAGLNDATIFYMPLNMVRNYSNNILRFVCFDVLLFTKCYSYNVDVDIKCKRKIKTKNMLMKC